jgi:hypothetical protein
MSTIRRKRVGEEGEWEFECSGCDEWFEKEKFRGCKTYTDPYGNCLLCSSCRAKQTRRVQKVSDEESAKELLTNIGFFKYDSAEEWYEAKRIEHGHQNKQLRQVRRSKK